MDKVLKAIGGAFLFAGGIILLIPISTLIGYFVGMILQMFCGNLLTNGLNLLLNTTRFTPSSLPIVCATLGAFSGYFRTQTTVKQDK